MEILPSLASLSGLTLLISVLIAFIKIFDESHKAIFIEKKKHIDKSFTFPSDNPAWGNLRLSYDSIKNLDPTSLQLVIKASFVILLLLSIAFFVLFWEFGPLSGYGGMFLKIISFLVVILYMGSAWLVLKMDIQKTKLNHDMERFRVEYKLLELKSAIEHEKKRKLS